MPYNLENIDCWYCGREIPLCWVTRVCPLCGAKNPHEPPWEHITSFKWRRLFRQMAAGFVLVLVAVALVTIGFLLLR